jgi:hypothetical protein
MGPRSIARYEAQGTAIVEVPTSANVTPVVAAVRAPPLAVAWQTRRAQPRPSLTEAAGRRYSATQVGAKKLTAKTEEIVA